MFGQSLDPDRLGNSIVEGGILSTLVFHYISSLFTEKPLESPLKFKILPGYRGQLRRPIRGCHGHDKKKSFKNSSSESIFLIILFAKTFTGYSKGQVHNLGLWRVFRKWLFLIREKCECDNSMLKASERG